MLDWNVDAKATDFTWDEDQHLPNCLQAQLPTHAPLLRPIFTCKVFTHQTRTISVMMVMHETTGTIRDLLEDEPRTSEARDPYATAVKASENHVRSNTCGSERRSWANSGRKAKQGQIATCFCQRCKYAPTQHLFFDWPPPLHAPRNGCMMNCVHCCP